MKVSLRTSRHVKKAAVQITGSKSETNRLLILQALYPSLTIKNSSESDDSVVLSKSLATTKGTIDVHHAGTAMRFLTAYFAANDGAEIVLTGSERMQQRPIGILVDALKMLGADISYVKNEGFPPLRIVGRNLTKNKVTLQANVSSQFVSALLLIAPSLPNGLELTLQGTVTSRPYIEMTMGLLDQVGVRYHILANSIKIDPCKEIESYSIPVESDWSSASYFYSFVALSEDFEITLESFKSESLQGDSALVSLYKQLGVTTVFSEKGDKITLSKASVTLPEMYTADLSDTPDIAQTIAVTCFGLGIGCKLIGLHTLKIKETDRLTALKTELQKLGATVQITEATLEVSPSDAIVENVAINTYNDHRMAMAFAPLALKCPILINDAEVVSKSFPTFWDDVKAIGLEVT